MMRLAFDPASAERRLRRLCWTLVALFTLIGLFWGPEVAGSVLAGGLVSTLNLEALARVVAVVTSRSPRGGAVLAVVGVGLRYLLLGVALFVIFSVWRANVVAASFGLSAPVLAIFFEWGLLATGQIGSNSDSKL